MKTKSSIPGQPGFIQLNQNQLQGDVHHDLLSSAILKNSLLRQFVFIAGMAFCVQVNGQTKGGIEQYNYFTNSGIGAIMPIIHFENGAGWHAEARYGYEAAKTFSLYVGKSFSHTGILSWSVTPMGGALIGDLKGGSVALNALIESKTVFLSTEPEYIVAGDKCSKNFFYNWAELGCNIRRWLFAGVTMQQTMGNNCRETQAGVMAGFRTRNFTFPLYYFDPLKRKQFFILGISWEWSKS